MGLRVEICSNLIRLWQQISFCRRQQLVMLFFLMVLASFAEILSIGAVLPFLGVLTAPEIIYEQPVVSYVANFFGLTAPNQLIFPIAVGFGLAALIAGSMRLLLVWFSTKLSFSVGSDLSNGIYRRTLFQSYTIHCARNSSEVIDGILVKSNGVIYGSIHPTLTLVSAVVMLAVILAALMIVEPEIALVTFGVFGLIYLVIARLTREQLLKNGKCIAYQSTQVIKSLQEGLGGIRDVLIDGNQEVYCRIYRDADYELRRAQGSSQFISVSPRFGVEALGMLFISVLAYFLVKQNGGLTNSIPILGLLALSAQRSLPLLQQVYSSWAQINSGQALLKDVLGLLDQPLPDYVNQKLTRLPFNKNINLKQVSFRYSNASPIILNNINLNIAKGNRIGFIGSTGSGKSTLLDILMGLLQPTSGTLEIDGYSITSSNCLAWQANIAHVPQVIFLSDSTIEENIAFGVPRDEIDHSRVRVAAEQAQISKIIEGLPMQYQTFVGERGIRLSGGQRQRIGIARALYKKTDVIIFDEATSALDGETEQDVMSAIESLSKELTVLIVAHRHATLKGCNQIIELHEGGIKYIGTYQDILNR